MSALLWIDTDSDRAIDLGNPFTLLGSFADMEKACGDAYDSYAELFGVPDATMGQEDADPVWLNSVRRQAADFLNRFGGKLGQDSLAVLQDLAGVE